MKRRLKRYLMSAIFVAAAVLFAFYIGGWVFLIKGFVNIFSSDVSGGKVIIGLLKVLIGFPSMEILAYFFARIGWKILFNGF